MLFKVTSAQLKGEKLLEPSSAESVRLRSCKQEKGWTGAKRLNKLRHLRHTVLPTESDDKAGSRDSRGASRTRR